MQNPMHAQQSNPVPGDPSNQNSPAQASPRQIYPACITNTAIGRFTIFNDLNVMMWSENNYLAIQGIRNNYIEATLWLDPSQTQFRFLDGRKMQVIAPSIRVMTVIWFLDEQACKAAYDFAMYLMYTVLQQTGRQLMPMRNEHPLGAPGQPTKHYHADNAPVFKQITRDPRSGRVNRRDHDDMDMVAAYYMSRDDRWRYRHRRRDGCCVCCNGTASANDSLFDWLLFYWCISSYYSPYDNRQTYACCNTVELGDLNCAMDCGPIGPTPACSGGNCSGAFDTCACETCLADVTGCKGGCYGDTPCEIPAVCDGCAGGTVPSCDFDVCDGGVVNCDMPNIDFSNAGCDLDHVASGCTGGNIDGVQCDIGNCDVCNAIASANPESGLDVCAKGCIGDFNPDCELPGGIDLGGCDGCSNLDLGGCDLGGLDLSGCDLSGCDLGGLDLGNC
ncbi:Pentapeptide repeats (8 copies) [Carpediemonas membranifera]|uniref:Pentapeptide repeats (8 copies) n=1 Tax=Carpediemonas membranifera TaxID=201153 RepID=A0A8J6AZK0_9EUKA|nr:Pentapeptide repeats (8 copies) [Carpediemonas membranifera]|eukprot:KAG9392238.1 Pentapeptide repeats (8 copies) [Carpediemonas membranifera]